MRELVRAIASLGGFCGRKGDGEPGWQTLFLGLSQIRFFVEGYRMARNERCQE